MLWTATLLAQVDVIPPSIIHEPVRSAVEGRPIVVEAVVTDNIAVAEATLYCRSVGMGVYYPVPMRQSADGFYESIPAEFVVLAGTEYYIEAKDKAQNVATYPLINAMDRPVLVEVVSSEESSFPEVTILNPEPGEILETGDIVIAISFVDREEDVDVASIRLKIDGRDVTRNARLSRTLVTYLPKEPFSKAEHSIWITVRDDEGHRVGPIEQTFVVAGAKPKWFGLKGDLMLGLKYDKPSIEERRENIPLWDNQVRLHLMGQVNWLHWDGQLYVSSDETSFLTSQKLEKRQPVNRYALNLRSRWFDITLGDSNPIYSDLSLKGVLVRGVNAEAHWKGASVTFSYGLTKRAIEGSTDYTDTLRVTDEGIVYGHERGTFRRMVSGTRLAFTRERGDVSVNLLQVTDDTTSIDVPDEHREIYKPKKNVVATVSGALNFNRRRTILSAEIGETVVTDNVYSVLDSAAAENLPAFVREREGFFRVNASTRTTIKPELSDNLKPRLYRFAFRTPVYVTYLKTEYYRVPIGYVSLGNPQQQTDVKGYKIDTRSRLFRDQIDALLGYDRYRDNVEGGKEFITTNGTIITNVGYLPDIEALAPYDPRLNIGFRSQRRTNDSPSDTTKVDNTTNTLTLSLGGKFDALGLAHHLNTDFMLMTYRDDNEFTQMPGFDSHALTMAWRSVTNVLTVAAVAGLTSNKDKLDGILTEVNLFDLNINYDMLGGRLNMYGGSSLILTSNDAPVPAEGENDRRLDSRKVSFSTGAKYQWTTKQSLRGGFKFIQYTDNIDEDRTYTEPIIEAMYRYAL